MVIAAMLSYIGVIVAQATEDVSDAIGAVNPWENWQIILGFLLPLALQAITKNIPGRREQALAAFGVSFVVTVIGMFISGELDALTFDIIATPLKVFVAVISSYKGFWNPIGVTPSTGEAALRH